MLRLKEGNYLAIYNGKMIEVEAKNGEEAFAKAKEWFEAKNRAAIKEEDMTLSVIPQMEEKAVDAAKEWFEKNSQATIEDQELTVCRIPGIIGVLS